MKGWGRCCCTCVCVCVAAFAECCRVLQTALQGRVLLGAGARPRAWLLPGSRRLTAQPGPAVQGTQAGLLRLRSHLSAELLTRAAGPAAPKSWRRGETVVRCGAFWGCGHGGSSLLCLICLICRHAAGARFLLSTAAIVASSKGRDVGLQQQTSICITPTNPLRSPHAWDPCLAGARQPHTAAAAPALGTSSAGHLPALSECNHYGGKPSLHHAPAASSIHEGAHIWHGLPRPLDPLAPTPAMPPQYIFFMLCCCCSAARAWRRWTTRRAVGNGRPVGAGRCREMALLCRPGELVGQERQHRRLHTALLQALETSWGQAGSHPK